MALSLRVPATAIDGPTPVLRIAGRRVADHPEPEDLPIDASRDVPSGLTGGPRGFGAAGASALACPRSVAPTRINAPKQVRAFALPLRLARTHPRFAAFFVASGAFPRESG